MKNISSFWTGVRVECLNRLEAVGVLASCCLLAFCGRGADEAVPPTPSELLGRFAATQEKQSSFVLKCEDKVESIGTGRAAAFLLQEAREVRTDGQRCYIHTLESQGSDGIPNLPMWRLWDGRRMFTYSHSTRPEDDYLIIDRISVREANLESQGYDQGPSRGYLAQDKERVDVILLQASKSSVRRKTERVGDSDWWVLDATTPRGKYVLWLDPRHGDNLAKAEVEKMAGDRDRDTILPKKTFIRASVVNARFATVNGVWVPIEAQSTFEIRGPEQWFRAKTSHRITEFLVSPDHRKLDSFRLMSIRNGAQVVISGAPKTPAGRWRDGRIIDAQGNSVELTGFGYDPLPESSKGGEKAETNHTKPFRVLK